jgi:hypothetical protein
LSTEAVRALTAHPVEVLDAWNAWAAELLTPAAVAQGAFAEWNGEAKDILHVHLPVARMERLLGHQIRAYTHALFPHTSCLRVSVTSSQLLGDVDASARVFPHKALRDTIGYLAGVTRFPPQVDAWANKARVGREAFAMRHLPQESLSEKRRSLRIDPAASRAPVRLGSSALGATSIDAWGEAQILHNVLTSSDHEETLLLLYVACSTPTTGHGNWTFPTVKSNGVFCNGLQDRYAQTTLVLSRADGTQSRQTTYSSSNYPLRFTGSGDPVLQLYVPLAADYVGWKLTVTYSWGLTSTTTFEYPFLLRGTSRIYPLLVRQLYRVPEGLTDGVKDAAFAKTRMSIAALGISNENRGYFNRKDLAVFFDLNRIDPWTSDARSGLLTYADRSYPLDGNDESLPDMETTLDISCAQGANNRSGLAVTHVSGYTNTPFEDMLNLALDDPTVHVLSIRSDNSRRKKEATRQATRASLCEYLLMLCSYVCMCVCVRVCVSQLRHRRGTFGRHRWHQHVAAADGCPWCVRHGCEW